MPANSTTSETPSTYERRSKRTFLGRTWYAFSTQQISGHPTIFNLMFSVTLFTILSVAYLIGGGILLTITLRQVQVKATYSDVGPLAPLSDAQRSLVMQGNTIDGVAPGLTTNLQLRIDEDMDAPIYMYIILEDFFQNHKRYVRSVNYNQVHGLSETGSSLDDCIPLDDIDSPTGDELPNDGEITPCGLTAWSYFNDTFANFQFNRVEDDPPLFEPLVFDGSDLVWDSDRDTFFGDVAAVNHNTIPAQRGGMALTLNFSSDEDFMTWLRPAAHPDVRKYRGFINQDLRAGDVLQFDVTHRFNTYDFSGRKRVLFTTQGPLGIRNLTFGLAWLVMGVLSGIVTVSYLLIGWKQLWNRQERYKFLQTRWERGNVHGPSRRAAATGAT